MKTHITVLREEGVEALAIKSSSIIVDATLGAAGHASLITERLGKAGTFVGIDADATAVEEAKRTLSHAVSHTHLCIGNFRDINSILEHLHISKVDGILADLGWRMEQFSGNGKGFSFQVDEPLIMTFGNPESYTFTACDIVNDWDEDNIQSILKGYGEERFSGRIARAIVEARAVRRIETTFELVEIIKNVVPSFYKNGRLHPATRTFQALRIAVNDEFQTLESFIKNAISVLNPNGRLAIITFHSLEDRIVKHLFRNYAHDQIGYVLTKKPISPSRDELLENPRARSAKLRIFEKI